MAKTMENPNEENIKCVIVGDNNVGKTRLVCARASLQYGPNNHYIKYGGTHIPTIWAIDHYRNDIEVLNKARDNIDGVDVSLRLWDTFGDHRKNRKFSYGRADVIIVCFSVCDIKSLEHVKSFWVPEARHHCKNVPVILVGCKIDLRFADLEDLNKCKTSLAKKIQSGDILYPEVCRQTASDIRCPYYETSICEGYGIKEVFENAVRAALIYRRKMYLYRNVHLRHVQKPPLQKPLIPPCPDPPKLPKKITNLPLKFTPLYDNPTYSDILIVGKNFKFNAHKVVLTIASNIFHQVFMSCLNKTNFSNLHGKSIVQENPSNNTYLITLEEEERSFEDLSCGDQEVPDLADLTSESSNMTCRVPQTTHDHGEEITDPNFGFDFVLKYSASSEQFVTDVLHLTADVSEFAFRNILFYCYNGHLSPEISKPNWLKENIQHFTELFVLSKKFRMTDFGDLLTAVLNCETGNLLYFHKFDLSRKAAIKNLILWKDEFSDIKFAADDGVVPGHKALLVCGSDVMNAMFGSTFVESGNKIVQFPETTVASVQAVFEYIYTKNACSFRSSNAAYNDIIALANRLCLPDLICVIERHIIEEFTERSQKAITRDLHESIVSMLEVAQLHNAHNLAEWCIYYIVTNYNDVCRKCKMVKMLSQQNQDRLQQCRWPPVWFIKDFDNYERACKKKATEDNDHRGKNLKRS